MHSLAGGLPWSPWMLTCLTHFHMVDALQPGSFSILTMHFVGFGRSTWLPLPFWTVSRLFLSFVAMKQWRCSEGDNLHSKQLYASFYTFDETRFNGSSSSSLWAFTPFYAIKCVYERMHLWKLRQSKSSGSSEDFQRHSFKLLIVIYTTLLNAFCNPRHWFSLLLSPSLLKIWSCTFDTVAVENYVSVRNDVNKHVVIGNGKCISQRLNKIIITLSSP